MASLGILGIGGDEDEQRNLLGIPGAKTLNISPGQSAEEREAYATVYNNVSGMIDKARGLTWKDVGDYAKQFVPTMSSLGEWGKSNLDAWADRDVIVPEGAERVMLDSGTGYKLPDGSYLRRDQLPRRSALLPVSRDETGDVTVSAPGVLGLLPALGAEGAGVQVGRAAVRREAADGVIFGAGSTARRAARAAAREEAPLGSLVPGTRDGRALELKLDHSAPGFGERVSTRTPSEVQVPDVHSNNSYQVGADSFNATRGTAETPYQTKTAELIAQQPGFERFANGNYASPAEVHEAYVSHLASNLERLHSEVAGTEWGPHAAGWYPGANVATTNTARMYDLTPRQGAGMAARLSPGTPWDMNVAQFNRTAQIGRQHGDSVMTQAMEDLYRTKYGAPHLPDGSVNKEYKPKWATSYETMRGGRTRLNDLEGPDAGLFVRLFDEAHNPNYSEYRLVNPDGTYGGVMPNEYTPNSNGNIGAAISILRDGSIENISRQLGNGHKIRSFYNNIISPHAGSDVTIDTHAMAAANLMPWGAGRPEVAYGFGNSPQAPFPAHPGGAGRSWLTGAKGGAATGSDGLYPLYAEAYRRVADNLGILPRELQSMTWEGIKGIYEPTARKSRLGETLLRENSDLWRAYENGERSLADTQSLILRGGNRPVSIPKRGGATGETTELIARPGLRSPDWWSRRGQSGGQWDSINYRLAP